MTNYEDFYSEVLEQTFSLNDARRRFLAGEDVDQWLDLYFFSRGVTHTTRRLNLAYLDFAKQSICGGRFYLSRLDGDWVVVDMYGRHFSKKFVRFMTGCVFLLRVSEVDLVVSDDGNNIIARRGGVEQELIVGGKLVFGGILEGSVRGVENYTYVSSKKNVKVGYPSVRLTTKVYSGCIRVHTIIALMVCGVDVVAFATGSESDGRRYDIHHRFSYALTLDNSPSNLALMTSHTHDALHNHYRGEGGD